MSTTDVPSNVNPVETRQFIDPSHRSPCEMNHDVRALSHDMTANFMLLENSFKRLKSALERSDGAHLDGLIAHIEACLGQSKRFLDDMALLGRTGSVPMEPASVEVQAVVDEVLFEQRDLLNTRNIEVEVRRPLAAVWCNRQRLKQVLTNLLRNAVKHGCHPIQPRITLSTETDIQANSGLTGRSVAIRVHDNGPGIPSCSHEEIFLPGRQLGAVAGKGTGMGLAIVRKIAEYYGGTAEVDPSCPAGTAILVRLPAASTSFVREAGGERTAENEIRRHVGHEPPRADRRPHRHPSERQRWKPIRPS